MKKYGTGLGAGWHKESERHSLASRGIKTGRKIDYMFSVETIKSMNQEKSREAEENDIRPLIYKGDSEDLKKIPNIGDHRPEGWSMIHTYLVDSSGLGDSSEPALTFDEFTKKVQDGFGYAIIEDGQFQVVIGEFKKNKKLDFAKGDVDEFSNDFMQAEMSNMTNDTSNPWKWKKGEVMNQWTRDKYYVIEKVKRYPDSGVVLKEISEDEANKIIGGANFAKLSVPEMHQLRIARRTLNMPDAMVGVAGGPNKEESREIIKNLESKKRDGDTFLRKSSRVAGRLFRNAGRL